MATPFRLSVLTPDQTVFEGEVEYVEAPGTEGYLGVLAHHAALVTGLASGTLTVRKVGGATTTWKVSGGFFEVSNNRATVLADGVEAGEGVGAVRRDHRNRTRTVTLGTAALLLPCLMGCAQDDPDTIRSVGRAIRIPPPPGMKFLRVADDGASRVFEAIDPALRQRKYTGVAWIEVHDEAAAESAFAERQERNLGADDTVGTARWREAMVDALMGSRAPLPEGPDMYPFIERIPMPEDAVAEMAFIRAGESRWVVGDAVLKASGRTVILNVVCRRPGDHGDLARVRQTLIDWIRLVRKANAPGGEAPRDQRPRAIHALERVHVPGGDPRGLGRVAGTNAPDVTLPTPPTTARSRLTTSAGRP